MSDKKVIQALSTIRDSCNQACQKDQSADVLVRASLATSAFNLASQVKPEVLAELYALNVTNSGNNLPKLDELNEKTVRAIKKDTIEHLAEQILLHVGSDFVDPSIKRTPRRPGM